MTTDSGPGADAPTAVWPRQQDETSTGPLIGSLAADRCATCGAPLASDQRYCVQCGERRGKPRFPVTASSPGAPEPALAPVAQREPRHRRVPSGATLVAGIATLLLAMGVGVEIGKSGSNNSSNQHASQPSFQVVTLPAGRGSAATTPTTTAAAANVKSKGSKKAAKTASAAANKPITKKVVTKAAAAASQVLGGSAPAQPTVQPGQKCSGGSANGCNSSGKFDGSFFGQ